MGGIFSSFAGSGLDICTFSVITLLFWVTEKTATPTSVVLMAGNTVVGFYWRQVSLLSTVKCSLIFCNFIGTFGILIFTTFVGDDDGCQ